MNSSPRLGLLIVVPFLRFTSISSISILCGSLRYGFEIQKEIVFFAEFGRKV